MKKAFVFCILFPALACKSGHPKTTAIQPVSDTAKFYPLSQFFTAQIQYVDLRNFPLYRITAIDGKKDSLPITKEQFTEWGNFFLEKAADFQRNKAMYTESVFHDLSTRSYTLNYTLSGRTGDSKNIDVLLDEESNMVKRVFIRNVYQKGDTLITEQYNWKAFKSFQVTRVTKTETGFTGSAFNYINWNDTP